MSVAALIDYGIGPGSSVLYLVTGGLDIGIPAPVFFGGGDPTAPQKRRKPEWRQRDEETRDLLAEARAIYERVVEGKTPAKEVVQEIRAAVMPHIIPSRRNTVQPLPPSATIDWQSLSNETGALMRVLSALQQTRQAAQAKQLADDVSLEDDDLSVIDAFIRGLE
jgi:hypothetical protein